MLAYQCSHMHVNSLVVHVQLDLTFEQSKNITIARFLVVSSSSCCWLAKRVWPVQ